MVTVLYSWESWTVGAPEKWNSKCLRSGFMDECRWSDCNEKLLLKKFLHEWRAYNLGNDYNRDKLYTIWI